MAPRISRIPRSRARRARMAAGVALGILLVVGGLATQDALALVRGMRLARTSARTAEGALKDLDIATARSALARASVEVRRAHVHADSVPLRLISSIPYIGHTARGARSLVDAAGLAISASNHGLRALSNFPQAGGRLSYGLKEGNIDPAPWQAASGEFHAAAVLARRAEVRARSAPGFLVLPAVASARAKLLADLTKVRHLTAAAASSSSAIPRLFGAEGTRRYLMLYQNLAEARGTGGLIGGYAILEVTDGRLKITRIGPDYELTRQKSPVPMPAWFRTRYDRFASSSFWSNVNMEPDLRVAGPLMADLFKRTIGTSVDGIITLDALALTDILKVTGPVRGPGGALFDARTATKFMLVDAYRKFPVEAGLNGVRKVFFAEAMADVWQHFLRGVQLRPMMEALSAAGSQKHLQLWFRGGREQSMAATLGVDGAFRGRRSSHFVGLVTQNAAANKADTFLTRHLDLVLPNEGKRGLRGSLRVELTNGTPASGLPQVILGPDAEAYPHDPPGTSRQFVSLYLGPDAALDSLRVNGKPVQYSSESAPDASIYSTFVLIPQGQSLTLDAEWVETTRARIDSFTVLRQPTVSPDSLNIRFSRGRWVPPAGFRQVGSRWDGPLDGDLTVDAR